MNVPPSTLPPGFLIDGRYEVLGPLGTGGQGSVYEVQDHHMGGTAALKLLTGAVLPGEVWKEATYLRRLEGKFLLPVLNADLASGAAYVVTAVADHGTVDNQVESGIGMNVAEAVRWARHASRGLARMHDHGLVHNDVKPANLFLDDHRDVLVGDLGYAQLLDATGAARVTGLTPQTAAPEVAAVAIAGTAGNPGVSPCSIGSDIYSLGATLYWMIAGMPAYAGDFWGVLRQVDAGPPPRLFDVAPHLPPALTAVVEKAMARNPLDRYASMSEFDKALGEVRSRSRKWDRVAPHPGHEQCFQGRKGSTALLVCVAANSTPGQGRLISVSHAESGRRSGESIRCTKNEVPRRLRAIFRQHQ